MTHPRVVKPFVLWLCALLAIAVFATSSTFVLVSSVSARQDNATNPQIQLRFEWGGGEARVWSGLLEIDNGRFETPRSLGIEADEPGSISIDNGAVWIQRRSARVYDGFDITVVASTESVLNFTLQSTGPLQLREHLEFKLSDILSETQTTPLGNGQLRLLIQRKPGDALAIHIDRPHLIYSPNDHFEASVALNLLGAVAEDVVGILNWELVSARSTIVLARGSQEVAITINSPHPKVASLDIALPEEEGVYDIQLNLSGNQFSKEQRHIQVVVLSGKPPEQKTLPSSNFHLKLVDEFVPESAGLFRKVNSRRKMKWFDLSLEKLSGIIPVLQGSNEKTDRKPAAETIWNAYQLNVRHPGRPHQLVVTAVAGIAQNIGISLLEPNAAGQLMPVGLDSGVYFNASEKGLPTASAGSGQLETGSFVEHRMIIWPKIREPILLLHNMKSGNPLRLNKVSLHEVLADTVTNPSPQKQSAPLSRLIGPYMHKPMLSENFGASEAYDSFSQRSLDDWGTFYTAGRRLADYLQAQGYNSLLLAVFADASTIYPSRLLEPTPRYDTGTYFSTGQDPIRKDVLELLFRIFDREGLILVPELQFSTPLPAIENILAADGDRSQDAELISRDGRTWRETNRSARGLAPYYNPLSPVVQRAILDAVAEVVDRYRQHDSFQGLAVELSSVGYLQLPGLEWGYDDATTARFERATGIDVPAGKGRERFQKRYEFLTRTVRSKWIRWRCEELARFHQRIAQVVTSSKPTARCIFSGNHILRGSNPDDNLFDALKTGRKLDDLLRVKGLDFRLYADQERLTFLRPSLWSASDRLLGTTLDETINSSPGLDSVFASVQSGALFYHRPLESRIAGFDAMSPWQPAFTWLMTQSSPGGAEARKRFVHSLAVLDAPMIFDGGWMIPLGQEAETRRIRDVVRALPDTKFDRNEVQQQPAVVRIGRDVHKTYLYVANEFSGPVDVELELSCSSETLCRMLGSHGAVTLHKLKEVSSQPTFSARQSKNKTPVLLKRQRTPNQEITDGAENDVCLVRFRLRAYDIWACELDDPTVRVSGVKALPNDIILASIENRIEQLDQRMATVEINTRSRPSFLVNPGFESSTGKQHRLVGWKVSSRPGQSGDSNAASNSSVAIENSAFWTFDSQNPRSGQSALLVASNQAGASLSSVELPLDGNTFLTMSLWMRSSRKNADVRLSLDGKLHDRDFVQFADVQVTNEWQRYLFRVKEIPSEGLAKARIRLEARQPGKLWVDDFDIQLHRLTPNEVRQLTKVFSAITLAWEAKRYIDCQRLLESYWGRFLFDTIASPATEMKSPRKPEQKKKKRILQLFRRLE